MVVVWQGSSWAVIAPDGRVVYRNADKERAYEWAKQHDKDTGEDFDSDYYEDTPAVSRSRSAQRKRKPQTNLRSFKKYLYTAAVFIGLFLCSSLVVDYSAAAGTFVHWLGQLNWFGLVVFALIVLAGLYFLSHMLQEGCLSGMLGVIILVGALVLCSNIGMLSRFLDWVF